MEEAEPGKVVENTLKLKNPLLMPATDYPEEVDCLLPWIAKSADEVIEALERIGISIPQSRTSA